MKKLFLSVVFVAAGFIAVNAQAPEGFQFGGGVRASLPVGDMSKTQSFGVGAELQGEYGFAENFSGVFTTGYNQFFGKKVTTGGVTVDYDGVGYIPFLAGVRYYPSSNFFIGAQAGYGLFTGNNTSSGGFNYQPQIGYNGSNFQVALGYNALTRNSNTTSHIGLTGIYKFGGGGNAKK